MPETIPGQPQSAGEPVFEAPWQARTFAMAVHLSQAGLFEWSEWTARLSRNLGRYGAGDGEPGQPQDADAWYRLWQATLEEMVREKT